MRTENPRHELMTKDLSRIENLDIHQMVGIYPLNGKPFRAFIEQKNTTKQSGNPRVLVRVDHSQTDSLIGKKLSLGGGTAARILRSWN